VSGMSGVSAHLDKVAEAICGASHAGKLFPWSGLSEVERDAWRAMAAAAVDALQLTEEIGYALPGEVTEYGQPDAWFSACDIRDAPDIAEKLNDGRQLFRRLVGPWVVQREEGKS